MLTAGSIVGGGHGDHVGEVSVVTPAKICPGKNKIEDINCTHKYH